MPARGLRTPAPEPATEARATYVAATRATLDRVTPETDWRRSCPLRWTLGYALVRPEPRLLGGPTPARASAQWYKGACRDRSRRPR